MKCSMGKSLTGAPDLFGLEQQAKPTNDRPESASLVEVLKALLTHPAMAWQERMNSGVARPAVSKTVTGLNSGHSSAHQSCLMI